MPEEAREYIFEVYGEACDELPSGPMVDRLIATIRDHPGSSRMELWRFLPVPRDMNYSAFVNILCAMVKQNLIAVDADDRYRWIGAPGT